MIETITPKFIAVVITAMYFLVFLDVRQSFPLVESLFLSFGIVMFSWMVLGFVLNCIYMYRLMHKKD